MLEHLEGGHLVEPETADDPLHARVRALIRAAKAPSTLRAYRADWRHFEAWCAGRGAAALPSTPETVALYLAALAATHRPATITRRLTAISKAHAAAGHPNPATTRHLVVSETLQGIRRTLGVAQKAKRPLVTADLLYVLAMCPATLAGYRDRALVLTGYAGALRRSELAALRCDDLQFDREGAVLTLRRSKTDQQGEGRRIALPRGRHEGTCPVQALQWWLAESRLAEGPLFRAVDRHGRLGTAALHPDAVGAIIQRALARGGLDPVLYGGHSLRAGFATEAARNGASAFDIMRQTGHRSVQTVSRYVREARLFKDHPAGKLGL
jgi:integrase